MEKVKQRFVVHGMCQRKSGMTAGCWRILRIALCFVLLVGGMIHAPNVGMANSGLDQAVVVVDADGVPNVPDAGKAADNACVDAGTCSFFAPSSRAMFGVWPSEAHPAVAGTLPRGILVFFLFRPPKVSVQA